MVMEEAESEPDPWLGLDKAYHVLMCLSLTFLFYALASLTPYRRHAISIGSLLSLLAGAAKEAADHLGYFRSSGASLRDALADLLGVLIASFILSLLRCSSRAPHLRALQLQTQYTSLCLF